MKQQANEETSEEKDAEGYIEITELYSVYKDLGIRIKPHRVDESVEDGSFLHPIILIEEIIADWKSLPGILMTEDRKHRNVMDALLYEMGTPDDISSSYWIKQIQV